MPTQKRGWWQAGDAWLSESCKTTILPASLSELKHHPLEIVLNKNPILCIIWFTVASDRDISSWMMRNQCDWSYRSHASNVLQKSYACPWRISAILHDLVFLAVQYVFFPESFCRISRWDFCNFNQSSCRSLMFLTSSSLKPPVSQHVSLSVSSGRTHSSPHFRWHLSNMSKEPHLYMVWFVHADQQQPSRRQTPSPLH